MSLDSFLAGSSSRVRSWLRSIIHRRALESDMEASSPTILKALPQI